VSFLLGGRVIHRQPGQGHRTGIEPVLLAASLPARPGERVLEGGSGSGAGLLCLAARVPGVTGLGVDIDPALAEIARANAAANGFAGLGFVAADLAAWRAEGAFDHAMANPPWHEGAATPSPEAGKALAKRAEAGLFAAWARALARPLRHRGTLTFVVGAGRLAEVLAAFGAAGCGSLAVLPLWPRAGEAARLVLARGVKGGRGPFRLLPGLALHRAEGGFTEAAEAVLRDGGAVEV
jgi:tRNA1(Val) A37 N6-methylase TrmN6